MLQYTDQQNADILARSRARAMAEAMADYSRQMQVAVGASLVHGDERSAAQARAEARASLHMFPALLAMVEPQDDAPVLVGLVERIGEWTGR